jgi:hypothetical protein
MERHTVILDDDFIVTFPNGWEVVVPLWTVEVVGIAFCTGLAAFLIWAFVRLINRRTKLPSDVP